MAKRNQSNNRSDREDSGSRKGRNSSRNGRPPRKESSFDKPRRSNSSEGKSGASREGKPGASREGRSGFSGAGRSGSSGTGRPGSSGVGKSGSSRSDSHSDKRPGKSLGSGRSGGQRSGEDNKTFNSGKKSSFSSSKRGSRKDDEFRTQNPNRTGSRPGRRDAPFKSRQSGESGESANRSTNPRNRGSRISDKREGRSDDRGSYRSKRTDGKPARADNNYKSKSKRTDSRSREDESQPAVQTEKIRLNRYIANSGVCSRREADELITMGLISVNGKTITELGFKVNPGDEVRYENKVLRAEKPVYILLNKPKGYLTTTSDPQERNTVMHLIGDKVRERIYPVGRLDRNTTGLLLLTNDGDLADKLMHPSYNVKKIYKVELDRPLTKADFETIQQGVRLEEGVAQVDDVAVISDDGKTVGIEIHIGWNRVIRRIFESLEYQVVKLDRSVYAGLDKKDLSRGQWRFLRQDEIVRLKHYK